MKLNENWIYGWFDDALQTRPTYDPPHDAPCLHCGRPIHDGDVRTHSLLRVSEVDHNDKELNVKADYAERCYFYRTHANCSNREGNCKLDGVVFDMISKNGD